MSGFITGKIDVTKVNKEWLFQSRSGAKYLDFKLIEVKNSKYGETHMVVQNPPKSVRDADPNARGPILGNATEHGGGQRRESSRQGDLPAREERQPPEEDDDVPF